MQRRAALTLASLLLAVAACSSSYPGAGAIERVASESVFVDTPPGLDETPVNTLKKCTGRGLGPIGEGGLTREVTTDRPLDPWLADLANFYAERAAADGWTVSAVVESDDPELEELEIYALEATREVEGSPMFLRLWVTIRHPGQGLYRFQIESAVEEGTYCR